MKIYEYNGDGLALGSTSIVIAASKKKAMKIINDHLEDSGLELCKDKNEINVIRKTTNKSQMVWFWNGDY